MTNEINTTYTRDSIIEAIEFMADLYKKTLNPMAAVKLDERQELAVRRFGYTWEEVEAIAESVMYAA